MTTPPSRSTDEPTVELMMSPEQRDTERRRSSTEHVHPGARRVPRWYTITTLTVGALMIPLWIWLAVHVAIEHAGPADPLLTTHLAGTAAWTVSAVALGAVWLLLWEAARREEYRNAVSAQRYEELVALFGQVVEWGFNREVAGWANGFREGAHYGSGTGVRRPPNQVTPLWSRPHPPDGGNRGRHRRGH